MTLAEIYKEISTHIIRAMMLHDEMSQAFDFLCLDGYKKMHEYYYYDETENYRRLSRYYINHHDKLIMQDDPRYDTIIPGEWYEIKREDITDAEKREAVRMLMHIWVEWEEDTKKMYEEYYRDLINMDEAASACQIYDLMCSADFELEKAKRHELIAKSTKYDMSWIYSEQDYLSDFYEQKIKHALKL